MVVRLSALALLATCLGVLHLLHPYGSWDSSSAPVISKWMDEARWMIFGAYSSYICSALLRKILKNKPKDRTQAESH